MACPRRIRDGPTRRRPPSSLPRPRGPGGPPRADRRTHPGWTSLCRNASFALLTFNGRRGRERILDPALEDYICPATGDRCIADYQGPGELADAKIAYGLDTG